MVTVSVVIATLGRVGHLEQCFASLRRSSRLPDEVVVVAQSRAAQVAELALAHPELAVRVVPDSGRGRGRALNIGVQAATGDVVLITDDDCRVRADWVEVGVAGIASGPGVVLTGRVLTDGDLTRVPALRLDPIARECSAPNVGIVAGGNMAAWRTDLLAFGFDERMVPAGEDTDFAWRWLKAGNLVRYEPELVIWHDDWRDAEGLRAVRRAYGAAHGSFYAKHLVARDPKIVWYVLRELVGGVRTTVRILKSNRSFSETSELAFFPPFFAALLGRPAVTPPPGPALEPRVPPAGPLTASPLGGTRSSDELAVVIATRNRREPVLVAIESALAQTIRADVLVMDDASTDGTAEAIRARFPGVRVETSDRPLGQAEQRNRGMAMTSAELVAMIDDDVYFSSPRTLEQAAAGFDHPRVAVACLPFCNVRREYVLQQSALEEGGELAVGVFIAAGAVFRRSAWDEVGGYERGLIQGWGEEGDLALRLIARGYALRLVEADPAVHWEQWLRKQASTWFLTVRNDLLLTFLRVPSRYLVPRMTVVIGHAVVRGLALRRPLITVAGIVSGFQAIRARREDRRPVPVWAYKLTRRLRRHNGLDFDEVIAVLKRRHGSGSLTPSATREPHHTLHEPR